MGDVHLSDRPPSIRTETYAEDILDKLRYCVGYANEHCDLIVLLGDVFHIKTPSKTSHGLVQRTAEVLGRFHGRVLVVPGNHDMSQDRLESLESQPLGALCLHPKIDLLVGYDEQSDIFGIPYLQNWATLPEWMDRCFIPGTPSLLVTHAPIFPAGDEPPYEFIPAPEWNAHMRFNIPVAYGHIHSPHGFYQAGGSWFCNNGAISRGSLHEETLKREIAVTDFDSKKPDSPFTSVPVPYRPADQVFRLAEHTQKVAAEERLDEFLGSIADVSLASLSLEEVIAQAATSGLSTAAQLELVAIIDAAVHG